MPMRRCVVLSLLSGSLMSISAASAAVVSARVVYRQGDAVAGGVIAACNSPFTDGNGRMAGVVSLVDGRRLVLDEHLTVLFDSGTVEIPALTGGEGTMGVSNDGKFIYSPSIDGEDGVYGPGGTILRGTMPAPGVPGMFSTFSSRPMMTANGTAYWVGGLATTSGGATSQRAIFQCTDTLSPASSTSPLMTGGSSYGGLTTTAQGLEFGYFISDNGLHRIHVLTAAGATTATDTYVAADNTLIAREGSPAPVGSWAAAFRVPGINNSGQFVLAGDTTAATTGDEIIISNTGMVMQEGTVIGGVTLAGTCNAVAINNLGDVAFTWGTGATEGLFRGPVASLMASAVKLVQVGDTVDTDGDGTGEYTVTDLEASSTIGPGLDIADDGRTFVEVTLTPVAGGTAFEAILAFGTAPLGCGTSDFNGDGDFGTDQDIEAFFACLGGSCCPTCFPGGSDFNQDGDFGTDQDIESFFRVLGGGPC